MKSKIEIKSWITGAILFEFECEENTIFKTIQEAVKADANLRDADLRGANLSGADLRGANLNGKKIKAATVFTGLYNYIVIPYITEENEKRVKMGCHDRSVTEWDADFWNNNREFPNNGSVKSQLRLMAYETAKKWFDVIELDNNKNPIK